MNSDIKYELYQNLGPLRSILRVPEHKMLGGKTMCPPPSKVGLRNWKRVEYREELYTPTRKN